MNVWNHLHRLATPRNLIFIVFAWIISLQPAQLTGQTHPFLRSFSAVAFEGKVVLHWTMIAGNTCNGIQIYRSQDSTSFARIGLIPGICGSEQQDETFLFTDSFPILNQRNFYYLELGAYGISQIVSVFTPDFSNDDYVIIPHPLIDRGTLRFHNEDASLRQLQVLNMQGQLIYTAASAENYFDLDTHNWAPGVYVFRIRRNGVETERIDGTLMVVH